MTNPICIYRKDSLDGVASGALVRYHVPACELFGITEELEFPWPLINKEKRTVYLVGFSLPLIDMLKLAEISDLVWIEQEVGAVLEAEVAEFEPCGIRHTQFAPCELVHAWFTGEGLKVYLKGLYIPETLRLLGDYTLGRKGPDWDSKVVPFQFGMRGQSMIYVPDSTTWQLYILGKRELDIGEIVRTGRIVLNYQTLQDEQVCARGAWELPLYKGRMPFYQMFVAGKRFRKKRVAEHSWYWREPTLNSEPGQLRALACNTSAEVGGSFFNSVYDHSKHDLTVTYYQQSGGSWRINLRTAKEGVDCYDIARQFGGTGSREAANFVSRYLPWE